MTNSSRMALAVALFTWWPAGPLEAQGQPLSGPLFAEVWTGGPLDSIYNAEYQRLQSACADAGDECYQSELDTTAVRLAPVFSSPSSTEPSGWLAARLRARGVWPYASLLFVGTDGTQVPLIDELGDWGYGLTLDLVQARGEWIQPWLLASVGAYWIGPDGGPGLGLVDGPFGLAGRMWRLGPVQAEGPTGAITLPQGVYVVLEVADGTVMLRHELPSDMSCGEPIDSTGPAPTVHVYAIDMGRLLGASGRPEVEVAYGKGC